MLFNPEPDQWELEITNRGGDTAVGLIYVIPEPDGTLRVLRMGNLAPSAALTREVQAGEVTAFEQSIWTCSDSRGHQHIWSYDGRHKSRRSQPLALEEAYREMSQ
jgi:hypothetical protein